MRRIYLLSILFLLVVIKQHLGYTTICRNSNASAILKTCEFSHYINAFNTYDSLYGSQDDSFNHIELSISNEKSWEFLNENIPFFECPDKVYLLLLSIVYYSECFHLASKNNVRTLSVLTIFDGGAIESISK